MVVVPRFTSAVVPTVPVTSLMENVTVSPFAETTLLNEPIAGFSHTAPPESSMYDVPQSWYGPSRPDASSVTSKPVFSVGHSPGYPGSPGLQMPRMGDVIVCHAGVYPYPESYLSEVDMSPCSVSTTQR